MGAGFTVIEYGGRGETGEYEWQLRNCLIERFDQEIVLDDSRTDMLFSRFTIAVTGYVHGETGWLQYHRRVGPEDAQTNHASSEQFGMRLFLEPRRNFRLRMGVSSYTASNPGDAGYGRVLLYAEPWPQGGSAGGMGPWDLDDGPRCTNFQIVHVAADQVYKVKAEFVVCRLECDSEPSDFRQNKPGTALNNTTGVLSNKWSVTDEIDGDRYTTRTYQGRLRIASSRLNAHTFRHVVVPPLTRGMRRMRMGFVASTDGKNLDWSVSDRDVANAAPWPATSWNVSHSIDTENAAVTTASVSVSLTGDRSASKRDLIVLGLYIVGAKLYGGMRLQQQKKGIITKRLRITDHIGEQNTVNVEAVVLQTATQQGFAVNMGAVFQRIAEIGKPLTAADIPNYDRELSRGGKLGDPVEVEGPIPAIGIFAARLQSPCNDEHETTGFKAETTTRTTNQDNGPTIEAVVSDAGWTESDSPIVSASHVEFPYSYYQVESTYRTTGMKAAAPVVRDPDDTATTATDDDVCKIVLLGPSQSRRIVRVRAERAGAWPVLPTPVDYDITNYVVGRGEVANGRAIVNDVTFAPQTTEVTATGEKLYVAAMDVEYLLTRTADASQPLRVGLNPWDTYGLQMTAGESMFSPESPSDVGITTV